MICRTFTSIAFLFEIFSFKVNAQGVNSGLGDFASVSSQKKSEIMKQAEVWEFHEGPVLKADNPECRDVSDDFFGKEIACLRFLVDKRFIVKEEVVPGDPTVRTTILKPDVYRAIRSIEKHFKRSSSEALSIGSIQENYNYILRVALAVVYAPNTSEFEKALGQERKNVANQISLFRRVKLL